jgi:putative membrane protein
MVLLCGVVFLLWWHYYLGRARRRFSAGERPGTERFWRMMNETPFVAAAVIVLAVTTKLPI